MTFKVSEPSAVHLRARRPEVSAVLAGRRTFEPDSTVHFVTDGIESAVNRANC